MSFFRAPKWNESMGSQVERKRVPWVRIALAAAAGVLGSAVGGAAQQTVYEIPASGVIGVKPAMLAPEFWVARAPDANRVLLTTSEIEARNTASVAHDTAMRDLRMVPVVLSREQVLAWMKEATAVSPLQALVDEQGHEIQAATMKVIEANEGADRVAATTRTRYGLSVRRAMLRVVPTVRRAYAGKDLTDFDSLQGGVLFPGEPVVIAHASVDGQWLLVETTEGAAWVAADEIAEGTAEQVFGYVNRKPFLVVTGDEVRTVFTPNAPEVSEVELDMGTRVPLAALPAGDAVNGQGPYVAWTIELPVRLADGALQFEPALVRKVKDAREGYLPLTRANILRQAFKFLGERYGWGHTFNARDCSGFTSDTYRSMGVVLPANSGAQGRSLEFRHEPFAAKDSHAARLRAVMKADVGDLVVVPGHVLMIAGKVNGQPYVIQDVPYAVFRDAGKIRMTKLNEVSVTPLLPLLADAQHSYVDAMTSLVHVTAR